MADGVSFPPVNVTGLLAAIPQPSSATPVSEAVAGNAGTNSAKFSMEGHAHARLTSATYATTGADGKATVTFTRSFANQPCPFFSCINNPGAVGTVLSWTQDGSGLYTGCTFIVTKRTASSAITTAVVALVTVLTGLTTTNTDTPQASQLTSVVMLAQSGA